MRDYVHEFEGAAYMWMTKANFSRVLKELLVNLEPKRT